MDEFDLSNYPKDHELYNPKNNKVIKKFKNESIKQITQVVAIRSKMYSYKVDGETKCKNRCKGIKKEVVKNEIKTEDYVHTLYTHEPKYVYQNGIRSYEHELYSETQYKNVCPAMTIKFIFVIIILIHILLGIIKLSKLL